jgi:hypothetical protein
MGVHYSGYDPFGEYLLELADQLERLINILFKNAFVGYGVQLIDIWNRLNGMLVPAYFRRINSTLRGQREYVKTTFNIKWRYNPKVKTI